MLLPLAGGPASSFAALVSFGRFCGGNAADRGAAGAAGFEAEGPGPFSAVGALRERDTARGGADAVFAGEAAGWVVSFFAAFAAVWRSCAGGDAATGEAWAWVALEEDTASFFADWVDFGRFRHSDDATWGEVGAVLLAVDGAASFFFFVANAAACGRPCARAEAGAPLLASAPFFAALVALGRSCAGSDAAGGEADAALSALATAVSLFAVSARPILRNVVSPWVLT